MEGHPGQAGVFRSSVPTFAASAHADMEWKHASDELLTTLQNREYQKALLRVPVVPIIFLAMWGIAVYVIQVGKASAASASPSPSLTYSSPPHAH